MARQGTWCFLTALAVFACNARVPAKQPSLGWLDGVGIGIWALGFGIEVLADRQKAAWRALPTSRGRYIDVGLWRFSRCTRAARSRGRFVPPLTATVPPRARACSHPNYFGEWVLWVGQYVLCASAFRVDLDTLGAFPGAGYLSALSFVFVYLLLNYISGVPLLEKKADDKWGAEPAYVAYKKETWVFLLLPVRRTEASRPREGDTYANVP